MFFRDEESGGGRSGARLCRTSRERYSWTALGIVNEKDWRPMEFLRDLDYSADRETNRANPECIRLAKIIAFRKYIISNDIAASGRRLERF